MKTQKLTKTCSKSLKTDLDSLKCMKIYENHNFDENRRKSIQIHEHHWKLMKINDKSMKINENEWTSMKINDQQKYMKIKDNRPPAARRRPAAGHPPTAAGRQMLWTLVKHRLIYKTNENQRSFIKMNSNQWTCSKII